MEAEGRRPDRRHSRDVVVAGKETGRWAGSICTETDLRSTPSRPQRTEAPEDAMTSAHSRHKESLILPQDVFGCLHYWRQDRSRRQTRAIR